MACDSDSRDKKEDDEAARADQLVVGGFQNSLRGFNRFETQDSATYEKAFMLTMVLLKATWPMKMLHTRCTLRHTWEFCRFGIWRQHTQKRFIFNGKSQDNSTTTQNTHDEHEDVEDRTQLRFDPTDGSFVSDASKAMFRECQTACN